MENQNVYGSCLRSVNDYSSLSHSLLKSILQWFISKGSGGDQSPLAAWYSDEISLKILWRHLNFRIYHFPAFLSILPVCTPYVPRCNRQWSACPSPVGFLFHVQSSRKPASRKSPRTDSTNDLFLVSILSIALPSTTTGLHRRIESQVVRNIASQDSNSQPQQVLEEGRRIKEDRHRRPPNYLEPPLLQHY